MAIQFLNNLQFNQNEALKLRLENLGTLPTTGNTIGRLAYKTGADAGVYVATSTGNAWVNLNAGDVESVTSTTTNQITTTNPNGPAVTIQAVIGAITNGGTNLCTSDVIFDYIAAIPGYLGTVTSVAASVGGDAYTAVVTNPTTAASISVTPQGTAAQYVNGAGNLITFPVIPQGDITAVLPGTYINIDNSTGPEPTINHDLTTRPADTTSSSSPAAGATFTVIDSVTSNSTGHITEANLKTVTMPPDNNDNTTYTLTSTDGVNTGIINLVGSDTSTDSVTIAGTTNEIKIEESGDTISIGMPAGGFVEWGVSGGNLQLPSNTVAQTQSIGDNTTKIATTAFVQASLTGLLEFKGGFNASTGAIVGGGNLTSGATRVAVSVGDYYVVTVDGNFFGNAATPLTVGDSVIVQTQADAGDSVEGDFIVVQSETDLATLTTVGIGNVGAGTATSGIDVSYNAGTASLEIDNNELTTSTALPTFIAGTEGSVTKKFAFADVFFTQGKKLLLDGSVTAGVTRTPPSGGITRFTVTLSSAWSSNVDGTNCMVEVTQLTNGAQVFADVTRTTTQIIIEFTNDAGNGDYSVLLNNVG
tara:strand:- start:205 stop:1968 length:1764 start_codon:yes stop_codon:yes gene_type:complete